MSTSNNTSIQPSNTVFLASTIARRYIIHLPVIFVVLGFIGFLGNTLTYLQKDIRTNPCSIYLFCGSIADITTLLYNMLGNYLAAVHGVYIPWVKLPNLCKFYSYFLGLLPHLSINFLVMAIIDRYASTCTLTVCIRRLNDVKMVPWLIGLSILLSFISSIRSLILYDYQDGKGCVPTQPLLNNILYTIINGTIQPVTMCIFVFLTFRNVRQSRQRVSGAGLVNPRRTRNQFISMILTQILATCLISLQWMIMYIYYFIPVQTPRTAEQQAIVSFFYSLTNYCYYLNNVKSFYLSMLTSNLFRKTFVKAFIKFLPRHQHQR
ncbi:unnamed protein product [Adineta ricciae]|uniref:G-protein coupled receptors family 1 profile domain-containing protein n=1 Tax=Adineta ricciae TaxID=249248 RepID=A0A815SHU3_ADIRI|nr:unnamed protein product [Adineta ricciae]CAF1492124.1 unnamed protein product [Adineta ricciae]